MLRSFVILLIAATTTLMAACRADTMREAEPTRSLATVRAQLTKDLTPATARSRLGAPDEETGSGLIIYKYRLAGNQTLWLGFPGYAPITYAQLEAPDGTRSTLTLR
jgi:hypothetical protein